nr:ALPV-066 [Albatrosspox virus]
MISILIIICINRYYFSLYIYNIDVYIKYRNFYEFSSSKES